jgi:hypothetical protein|tara:strand:+ start:447 stop:818 length:372 start_codon:yes stop_codon:yes gene_type:complete
MRPGSAYLSPDPVPFFWNAVDMQICFTTDDSGAVTGRELLQGSLALMGKRLQHPSPLLAESLRTGQICRLFSEMLQENDRGQGALPGLASAISAYTEILIGISKQSVNAFAARRICRSSQASS